MHSLSISFAARTEFLTTLKTRVDAELQALGRSRTGGWRIALKVCCALTLLGGGYTWLVCFSASWSEALLAACVMIAGAVLLVFGVFHDASHGSLSTSSALNALLAASVELFGGSHRLWHIKHNQLHHTYTNISPKDDDIDIKPFIRVSPDQAWRPWHQLQHIYGLPLYCFLSLYWFLWSDFSRMLGRRIGATRLSNTGPAAWGALLAGKLIAAILGLGIPLVWHDWTVVIPAFILFHLIFGFILALTFQLAHVVEGPLVLGAGEVSAFVVNDDWAAHQIRTTANFANNSALVTFFSGGLNYQIEHHLLHRISHVHYPALAPILRQTCAEFELPYCEKPTLFAAIKSHIAQLKLMGRAPASI